MSVQRAPHVAGAATPQHDHVNVAPVVQGDMVELTLSENGMIRDCNKACGKLFGCLPSELMWRHISVLLPQLTGIPLMLGKQINPRLRFLTRIGRQFEVVGVSGARFLSEIFFNDIESLGRHYLRLIICPVDDAMADAVGMPG